MIPTIKAAKIPEPTGTFQLMGAPVHLQPRFKVKGKVMRIGEMARRTDLSASRIRFYEGKGLIPKSDREENGYRDYPESVEATLRLISGAQVLGFSLAEIREGLVEAGDSPPSKNLMLNALRAKLGSLDAHIEQSKMRRAQVMVLIEEFENECP